MPSIQAFRGIRYDLGRVGTLQNVVAPPYDVIDGQMQQTLYERHPANIVRLILNRSTGNEPDEERYRRAGHQLREWLRDGTLFRESDPAVYVYHQVFSEGTVEYTRRGVMCRVRLESFGEGSIHPHEETHAGAKADRLKLWRSCRANLSQIFGLYPDPDNAAQDIVEVATAGRIPLEVTDDLGVIHRLWPVTDVGVISSLTAAMSDKPVYIADGHHRYETACNYRDELSATEQLGPEHPANYVLMMCVSLNDPGMLVLPTHRLLRGMPSIPSARLAERLGGSFDCKAVGQGAGDAIRVWEHMESLEDPSALALFTNEDQCWTLARVTAEGKRTMSELSPNRSTAWRDLGVSLLHELIVRHLLDVANAPPPKYVRSLAEIVDGLEHGDQMGRDLTGQVGQGERFELAALVMPPSLADLRAISGGAERMPAKSTYFYPKLLSGLVINPLE